MKKIFSCIAILFTAAICTYSQVTKSPLKKTSIYAGAQASVAAADLADTHSVGLGVNTLVAHRVSNNLSLTGRVSYTYLFGKKFGSSYYEPGGGNYNYSGRYKGMNDFGFTGGVRYNFNNNWAAGGEAGLCVGSVGGESESSGMFLLELLYFLGGNDSPNPFGSGFGLYFALCGDPEVQIGLRYTIRL